MLHFLGIGAQKAGTTWLYHQLREHPQVCFPAGKEVHFWDRDEERDVAWYRGRFEQPAGDDIRNGEITPAYAILSRECVEEIYAQFPAARLLYIIRDPIERAWSSALMALERAEMDLAEASDQWFIDHFNSKGSLLRGDYETCIRTWESVYPKEQLLLLRYESIRSQPRQLLERVAAHLGIDAGFFAALPEHDLKRRVFAGSGHPLRPSLRPVLERIYGDKIRSLGAYLGTDLEWTGGTRGGAGGRETDEQTRLERAPTAPESQHRPAPPGQQAGHPTAILVLGMHRSGTSALTRVISLLGADLPSNLMPAVERNNEAGFWESLDAYRLNDDILASAGSGWDDWRRVDPDWMRSPDQDAFKARALALLEQDFSGSSLFVLKDPRICRLLPFWLEVLTDFGAEVKCALSVRSVLEVAASLEARDGFGHPKSHMLWLRHVLDAEWETRGLARAFVTYDGLLDDWRREVRRLSDGLGIAWPRRTAMQEAEIDRFLRRGHRHHAMDGPDALEDPKIPAWVKESCRAIGTLVKDPGSEAAQGRLDAVREELDRASDALGALVRSEELARDESRRALAAAQERLRGLVATQESQRKDLEREAEARDGRVRALERMVSERDGRIAALGSDLGDRQRRHADLLDQRNRMAHRLNGIQTSASWQLGRPLRTAEGRFPGIVRGIAAAIKLIGWTLTLRLPERLRLRRQANDLLAAGLFDLPWYVERNPDLVLSGVNPLLHWLVAGWREGRDPNALFATDWYLQEYPQARDAGVNPLTHFLIRGAAEECDPMPLFQTSLYIGSHPGVHSPAEALRHFAESGKDVAAGAYRSAEVLSSLQRAYRAKTQMRLLRDERAGSKRFALYLQCGSGSIHGHWLSDASRPWDLIVNHYDPTYVGKLPCDVEFRQVGELPGTKFTSFHGLLQRWPKLAGAYDYLLLLDDDIRIEECGVTALFDLVAEEGLDLAQPSLSAASHGCHGLFRASGAKGLRYVNGVEIMMPVISRRALDVGGHLFGETISGWGLDLALAKLVERRLNGRAAVADGIQAEHNKPIDLNEGAYYKMLAKANIYPLLEYRSLRQAYDADATFHEL